MYFSTERVANRLLELYIHLAGLDHCFLKLLPILEELPPQNLANRHDTPYEGATGLPSSGYPSSQRTSCLKRSYILQI